MIGVLLFALAGLLAGGAWAVWRQKAPKALVGTFVLLAAVAIAGAVLWSLPGNA
jgi:hypothetical protein